MKCMMEVRDVSDTKWNRRCLRHGLKPLNFHLLLVQAWNENPTEQNNRKTGTQVGQKTNEEYEGNVRRKRHYQEREMSPKRSETLPDSERPKLRNNAKAGKRSEKYN